VSPECVRRKYKIGASVGETQTAGAAAPSRNAVRLPVVKVAQHRGGVRLAEHVLGDQTGQVGGVHPAGRVVAGRDRGEPPGVVDEPGAPVEPGGLGHRVTEPAHGARGVQEPPRRAQVYRRVEPGQRGELPGEHRLVQGEQHGAEAGMGAEALQQGPQQVGELGAQRQVVTGVRAEPAQRPGMVVAAHPGVQRHHQPVLGRHAGHLAQAGQPQGVVPVAGTGADPTEQPVGLGGVEELHPDVRGAVVGGGGAVFPEVHPAGFQRGHQAVVVAGVDVGGGGQPVQRRRPAGNGGVGVGVRPEGGQHPAVPVRVGGQRPVVAQVVGRVVGGGQRGQVERAVQRAGPVARLGQPPGQLVEQLVGGVRTRLHPHLEHIVQLRLQPLPGRRSQEQRPVRAEGAPHLPRPGRRAAPLAVGQPEPLQGHPVGVQQPGDVVVRGDQ
jgi:hypothetical protein